MVKVGILAEMLMHRHYTGVEYYLYNLLKNLLRYENQDIKVVLPSGALKNNFPKSAIVSYNPFFKKKFQNRFLTSITSYPNCLKNFDIIHAPTITTPFFRPSGTKAVMTVHDLFPNLFPKQHPFKRRLYFNHFLKYRLKYVDRLIAVSENTKKDLISLFQIDDSKIDVVYEGVSEKFMPAEAQTKQNYILAVSTLEPRKNFNRLINAYILLKEKYGITEKLYIVGKKDRFFKEINYFPNRFRNDIVFKGYVTNEVLVEMYQKAKLFIYPSMYEGFGLPVIEAMACGCPVITSNISSLPEVGGKAAVFVNPTDTIEISEKMYVVLSDPILCAKMSQEGLKQAKKFTWRKCAEETIKVYEKMIMK